MTDLIVICHGKSEIILARWIQKESRVVSNIGNDGRDSIMIDSLPKFMRENGYYDSSKLKKRHPDIEYRNRKGFKDLHRDGCGYGRILGLRIHDEEHVQRLPAEGLHRTDIEQEGDG